MVLFCSFYVRLQSHRFLVFGITKASDLDSVSLMAAARYRKFLRLCENWPLDKSKRGRDLAAYIREEVAKGFKQGEVSQVNEAECDRIYNSLNTIQNNTYKQLYHRSKTSGCTGLTLEQCQLVNSSESLDYLQGSNYSLLNKFKSATGTVDKPEK